MSKRRIVSLVILLVVATVACVLLGRLWILIEVGSGYTAKQVCSCVYVSKRTEDSCARELEDLAKKLVRYEVKDGRVHAATLGMADRTARYDEGFGCVLDD